MPISEGDLVQISWKGSCFNQRIILTRNFRVTGNGASAQPTAQTLAQIIDAVQVGGDIGVCEQYLACLSNNYSLDAIRAQVVIPVRSAFAERTYVDTPGTGGSNALSNVQGAITLRTANAGRNQVSTIKVGPSPAAFTANGDLNTTGRANLNSLRDFMIEPWPITPPGIILSPIIWHAPNPTFDAIIGGTVHPQARVMVRRTVGRGE